MKTTPRIWAFATMTALLALSGCGRAEADAAKSEAEFWQKMASGHYPQRQPERRPQQQAAWGELSRLIVEAEMSEAAQPHRQAPARDSARAPCQERYLAQDASGGNCRRR